LAFLFTDIYLLLVQSLPFIDLDLAVFDFDPFFNVLLPELFLLFFSMSVFFLNLVATDNGIIE